MREIVSPLDGIRSPFGPIIDPHKVAGQRPPFVADFGADQYRVGGAGVALSDALTFSRAGNATMVDSDGLLKWSLHNLLRYSEDFSTGWGVASGASVETDVAQAPNGTMTADRLLGLDVASGDRVTSNAAVITNATLTGKIWFKGEGSNIGKDVRLTAKRVSGGTFAGNNTDITLTGDWQLVSSSFTQLPDNTAASIIVGNPNNGNEASSVLVWGAHLYRSDLGGMVNNPDRGDSYVPTTSSAVYLPRRGHHVYNGSAWVNEGLLHESEARTNLVTYSNDFTASTGAWFGSRVGTLANDAEGVDGLSSSATTVVDNSAGGSNTVYVGEDFTVSTSTAYTFSIFAKADQLSGMQIRLVNFTTPAEGGVYFNLSSGVVGTANTGLSGKIEDFGSGWYRCSVTFTTDSTDTAGTIRIFVADGENLFVDLDGTSSILIYGAQFEAGSSPSSVIPTTGSTVTRAAETLTASSANLPWPTPNVLGTVIADTFDADISNWTDESDAGGAIAWNPSGYMDITRTTGIARANISLTVTQNSVYRIRFDILNADGNPFVYVGSTLGGTQYVDAYDPVVGTNELFVVAADNTTLNFRINNFGSATTVSVDNFIVEEIDPLAVSIAMEGRVTYADENAFNTAEFFRWRLDGNNYIEGRLKTDSTDTGEPYFVQTFSGTADFADAAFSGPNYTPGVLVPFNIASRHGSTFINGAVDGTALTANITPTALPDLSSTDLSLGYDYMGTISLLRIWSDDIGDVGISEASA